MSELKAIHAYTLGEVETICNHAEGDEYYLKSEVYKVIAYLEESHKKEVEQLLMEIVKLKEKLKINRDARKYWRKEYSIEHEEARHHKYKRCLAMARLCGKTVDHLNSEGYIYEKENHTKELTDCIKGTEFYDKWYHRWFALAEKFKEAK